MSDFNLPDDDIFNEFTEGGDQEQDVSLSEEILDDDIPATDDDDDEEDEDDGVFDDYNPSEWN